jgi:regulator of protease activity HflC (stomatin/prohibitin superfamily)
VPSVSRKRQLAVLALGAALAVAGLTGCETTQEKAEAQRAESARILKARGERQARKHDNHDADGTKSGVSDRKSSRQREEKG